MADDDLAYLSSLSAHPNRPGDTSNFNSGFAANLASALREANAAGLKVGLESGYRTPGQTGSSFDASGRSLHSYGLAADISGLGGANSQAAQQWAVIAARHNLYNPYGVGNRSEFNHWQAIPNELTQADVPAFQQAFKGGGVPTGYAAATGPAPANTLGVSNPFIRALGDAESNWRNIYSTVDKDPAGPGTRSQGYLQIDTPTWKQYAGPSKYPDAMAAPLDEQIRVASLIPVSRFGPRTQDLLHKQFGAFDNSATVGELASKFGGATAAAQPATPGTTLTSTPVAAAVGILPGFKTKEASDAFSADMEKMLGGQAKGQTGSGGGGQQQQQPIRAVEPIGPLAQARNVPQGFGYGLNPGGAQIQALQAGTPMGPTGPIAPVPEIGAAPPGQNPWAGVGVQLPGTSLPSLPGLQALAMQAAPGFIYGYTPGQDTQFPQVPGMSLGSLGGFYG